MISTPHRVVPPRQSLAGELTARDTIERVKPEMERRIKEQA